MLRSAEEPANTGTAVSARESGALPTKDASEHYLNADELAYYKARATRLRAQYIGAAFTRLRSAVARGTVIFVQRIALLAGDLRKVDCA